MTSSSGSRTNPKRGSIIEGIDFSWGAQIPLRDGTRLGATIYRPKGSNARTPVIFTLSPYVADTYHERAAYFARNGYCFALVDCRGRGNSTGNFEPLTNEGHDGYDVVEWLARQSWSNGKVAMWGGSYAGCDQWAALKESPPHLRTIVPAASCYPGVDFPFLQNIWYSYMLQWLTLTSGHVANNAVFADNAFWIEKFREHYLDHRPYRKLDKTVGNTSTVFQEWLKHPVPDAYWNAMVPTSEQYRRINIPILTITGQYDADQPGALEFYKQHMRYGSSFARKQHYLIIGPWDHPGTRTPKREVGGLTFGEASLVDLNKLHRDWYDWTLKSGPKPALLKKRVAYYVTGAEEWKYTNDFEDFSGEKQILYLSSTHARSPSAFNAGIMHEKPENSPPDEFVNDPLDTRMAEVEKDEVKKTFNLDAWEPVGPSLGEAVLGMAAGFGALAAVAALYRRWRGRDGMGLGDAKLLGAAGAWVGAPALPLTVCLAASAALVAVLAARRFAWPLERDGAVAFGPFLCLAVWIVFLTRSDMLG